MADTSRRESQLGDLEAEILVERAGALGSAGRRLEASIESLARAREADAPEGEIDELVYRASMDLWSLLLQREAYGSQAADLERPPEAYSRQETELERLAAAYEVPAEVVARVGVVRPGKEVRI